MECLEALLPTPAAQRVLYGLPKPWRTIATTQAFPVHCLPSPAREMAEAAAASIGAPVDMTAIGALAAASTVAVGSRVSVKVDYDEALQAFFCVSADPSERKSSVQKVMLSPLREWEREENIARREQVIFTERKRRALDAELNKASDDEKIRTLSRELAEFEPVYPLTLATSDATPEALARLMACNEGRCAIVSAEGATLNTLMGQYSSHGAANVDIVCQGYTGESVDIQRVSREAVHLDTVNLSIWLCVQPVTVESFIGDPTVDGRGLNARFLYARPASVIGTRKLSGAPAIPFETRIAYNKRMRDLCKLRLHPVTLTLSPEAFSIIDRFYDEIEPRIAKGGDLYGLCNGWGGKLVGNSVRIAGLLKLLDSPNPQEKITASHTRGAIEIARYFVFQLKGILGAGNELSPDAQALLKEIVRQSISPFDPTALKRKLRRRAEFENATTVDDTLAELQEADYLRPQPVERREGAGRSKEPLLLVNPHIMQVCAPQAEVREATL